MNSHFTFHLRDSSSSKSVLKLIWMDSLLALYLERSCFRHYFAQNILVYDKDMQNTKTKSFDFYTLYWKYFAYMSFHMCFLVQRPPIKPSIICYTFNDSSVLFS